MADAHPRHRQDWPAFLVRHIAGDVFVRPANGWQRGQIPVAGMECLPCHREQFVLVCPRDLPVRPRTKPLNCAHSPCVGQACQLEQKRGECCVLRVRGAEDRVVESIAVSKGLSQKLNALKRKAGVNKWFYPKEGFGNWRALHIGSTTPEVGENLGETKEKWKGGSVWIASQTSGRRSLEERRIANDSPSV